MFCVGAFKCLPAFGGAGNDTGQGSAFRVFFLMPLAEELLPSSAFQQNW
jgi:hypothetical protein